MAISIEDFLTFCDRTIGFHLDAVGRLDDDQVNLLPDLPAPNSPYQLVTHAFSACRFWADHIVCGNPTDRDRDAEFDASGTVAELVAQGTTLSATLHALAPELDAATGLAHTARTSAPLVGDWTVGAALIHAYEELAQHLGHLEITVDLILGRTA